VLNVNYVDVNEKNPQAVGFYKHLGFKARPTGKSIPYTAYEIKIII